MTERSADLIPCELFVFTDEVAEAHLATRQGVLSTGGESELLGDYWSGIVRLIIETAFVAQGIPRESWKISLIDLEGASVELYQPATEKSCNQILDDLIKQPGWLDGLEVRAISLEQLSERTR